MKKQIKRLAVLGLCTVVAAVLSSGAGISIFPMEKAYAAEGDSVAVSDLVIKFLGVPEYEPNRYTKSNGGKWAPEELEKGLLIKADMVLGEGNPEGMMAPLKYSLADITGNVDADQATGDIIITYNGLTLKMKAGSTGASLDNGKSVKTLTMRNEVAPYFKQIEGEKNDKGEPYYACYLPVKFTAEALGGDVVWNEGMHRMEMAFAFYYSDAAVSPIVNSSSLYTTKKMESNSNTYSKMKDRVTVSDKADAAAVAANVADMMKAAVTVVHPAYQNDDGGWGKTNTDWDLLEDSFASLYNHAYSTIDNGATHGHIKFLTRVLRLAKENPALFTAYASELDTIEKGFWKAVAYMLDAQTDLGGWQQYYPYGVGYFANITFNDNAMPDVLELIYALTNDSALTDNELCEDFAWARQAIDDNSPYAAQASVTKENLQAAWDKGLDFTLDAQVVIDGTVTGWAQQYDANADTPTPAGGRAFELPSVSPDESLTVVKVLANIKNPSERVKNAINSYVGWIQTVGFTGYQVYTISDRTRELGKDKLLLKDGSNKKQFGRFYGLDITGEYYGLDAKDKVTDSRFYEIFAGRNGVAQFTMNNGMSERRIGYSYLRTSADTNALNVQKAWKKALGE